MEANSSRVKSAERALAVCICLCFYFLNMDLCLLADRAKWSNCCRGLPRWPGCGVAQTGNLSYNRDVLRAGVTQQFQFFQNSNMWVCQLILTGVFCSRVQESVAVISGREKEQKTAFREKWVEKTVSLLTVLALESQFEFIWAWGLNVSLLFWIGSRVWLWWGVTFWPPESVAVCSWNESRFGSIQTGLG